MMPNYSASYFSSVGHGVPSFAILFFLTIFVCIPHLSHSYCKSPPVIFNLGDSNSDTGGLFAGLGYPVNLPNGRTFFRRSTGRLSDGRLLIDFLCQSLNTSLLSPYLDSLGSNFSNGANFAVGGSVTLPKNLPFALNIQVRQFKHFKEYSAELAATGDNGLIGHDKFSDALYMIDIGQNDIGNSFTNLSYVQVVKKIPSILAEIRNAVKEIYDEGGRNFWVHNTGPLGCLPQKLALLKNVSNNLDSFGCISSYNDAAKLFNEGLRQACIELRLEMKDARIVYVDVYAIKLDIIANSTKYVDVRLIPRFSEPTDGGPPYNYEKRVECGFPGCQVCEDATQYVSWDGIHYTEAANAIIASKILSTTYSTPPLSFNFFCQ